MTKKILLVCMVDSIHSVRWMQHFKEKDVEITVFPSRKYKKMHEGIFLILANNPRITFLDIQNTIFLRISGYIDFFMNKFFAFFGRKNFREILLNYKIRSSHFDFVHALESQSAGYLCSKVLKNYSTLPLILNCWGSDIYFYKNRAEHRLQLQLLLNRVNYFSADCKRDYLLANEFGFDGIQLPSIPSIEPIQIPIKYEDLIQLEERNHILIKGYGAPFGDLGAILPELERVLISHEWINLQFYSLDKEYIKMIKLLMSKYPSRVTFISNKKPISNLDMQKLFSRALIHIGYSKSDGLPAAVIESMKWGAYPIQTNTSCVEELILNGASASLIKFSSHNLGNEIESIIEDMPKYRNLVKENIEFVNEHYSFASLKKDISAFYN
jgi:glycosyltransferase involved in cell wall biosynthesis